MPRKGIISKVPYSNTRQFGIATLWRKKRQGSTGKALGNILNAPLFQNRVRMWTLLQDLGSNTRRRYEQTQYIRSSAVSLEGCYALRRLGVHLPETHQKLVLQAIDGAIHFRKGKTWQSPSFSGTLDAFPTIGFPHSTNSTNVVFWHQAHCSTMPCTILQTYLCEAPFTDGCHMQSQGSYSKLVGWNPSELYMPILRQFPSARAFPNLQCEHWVLDGALLAPLLQDRLLQIVGGFLNNKIFPNKEELQRLFLEAFHQWTKLNAIPCPSDEWILQTTLTDLGRSFETNYQSFYCGYNPTAQRTVPRLRIPQWRQTSFFSANFLPLPIFSMYWQNFPWFRHFCQIIGNSEWFS